MQFELTRKLKIATEALEHIWNGSCDECFDSESSHDNLLAKEALEKIK